MNGKYCTYASVQSLCLVHSEECSAAAPATKLFGLDGTSFTH